MLPQTERPPDRQYQVANVTDRDRPADTPRDGRRVWTTGEFCGSVESHRRRRVWRTGRQPPRHRWRTPPEGNEGGPRGGDRGRAGRRAPQVHAAETLRPRRRWSWGVHTDAVISRSWPPLNVHVRSDETLSSIAARFDGNVRDWPGLYHVNESKTSNPTRSTWRGAAVPASLPANVTSYAPKHARHAKAKAATTLTTSVRSLSGTPSGSGRGAVGGVGPAVRRGLHGGGDRHGLNRWQRDALSPTNDYGDRQINGRTAREATFDAYGNARAAIAISDDGRDWSRWTTTSRAPTKDAVSRFAGRCRLLPASRRQRSFARMDHPEAPAWQDRHIEALDETVLPDLVRTLRTSPWTNWSRPSPAWPSGARRARRGWCPRRGARGTPRAEPGPGRHQAGGGDRPDRRRPAHGGEPQPRGGGAATGSATGRPRWRPRPGRPGVHRAGQRSDQRARRRRPAPGVRRRSGPGHTHRNTGAWPAWAGEPHGSSACCTPRACWSRHRRRDPAAPEGARLTCWGASASPASSTGWPATARRPS